MNEARWLFSLTGALAALLSFTQAPIFQTTEADRKDVPQRLLAGEGEYFSFIVAIVLGANLMAASRSLLMLYLSVEFVSICSYALASFRFDRKAAEGSLKYLVFGGFSSALMLYGASWLYGLSGTVGFEAFALAGELAERQTMASVGVSLFLCGLLFKVAAAPFHVWAPDAYEGAATPVAAFFSVAPKAAGAFALVAVVQALPESGPVRDTALSFLTVAALASLFFGNLSALWQKEAKRLLAYSGVAQAGFLLVPVIALPFGKGDGGLPESLVFYLEAYLFANMAAFALVTFVERRAGGTKLYLFRGLGTRYPWLGAATVAAMVSLTGLPPTAGFTAKLLVFSDLWGGYLRDGSPLVLALFALGLLNAVVALFYYLRLPYLMFFKKGKEETFALTRKEGLLLAALTVPLVVWFFLPGHTALDGLARLGAMLR